MKKPKPNVPSPESAGQSGAEPGREPEPAVRFATLSQVDEAKVRWEDVLSADVPISAIAEALQIEPEEFFRDGLGPHDFIVIHSETIGYRAFAGSKVHPEFGAAVWAEVGAPEAELVSTVRRTLGRLRVRLMRASDGTLPDGVDSTGFGRSN